MSSGEDKEPKSFEFSVAGYKVKYSNKLLAMVIAIAPVIGGTLWGGFEAIKGYQNMQKKIESYVAPDLTEFDKRLALVEETTAKTNDYTRDIKNDIKNDIRKLEKVVEQVERDSKDSARYMDRELRTQKERTEKMIKEALDNPMNGK